MSVKLYKSYYLRIIISKAVIIPIQSSIVKELFIVIKVIIFYTAFSSSERKAHVDGHYFKCWYYNPSYVIKCLKNDFDLLSIEDLCTLVPPSYVENFAEKYPPVYQF
ncbi:MAG TPA: hypothetical protein VIJ95_07420 [Hanamia sp.]